jgi:hypothetical protein
MNTGLAFLLSWALALAGMAALALAIDRHHGQLHGDGELSRRRAVLLQVAGCCCWQLPWCLVCKPGAARWGRWPGWAACQPALWRWPGG